MKEAIALLVKGQELSPEIMGRAIRTMMSGEANDAQIGAFLSALSIKGASGGEISAAVAVMRELMDTQPLPAGGPWIDVVGTGGDGLSLFNVSTASALVAASGGVKIAKHGNVGVSSSSGSADLLRAAGYNLNLQGEALKNLMERGNFGFMFAPNYHRAMGHVAPARRAIGIRTIFNVLGPLANPARVQHMVLGVYSRELQELYGQVGQALGLKHLWVIHGDDGSDELSVCAASTVLELRDGQLRRFTVNPTDYGFNYRDHGGLQVNDAAESLALIRAVLQGDGPNQAHDLSQARDLVALNTAPLFLLAGLEHELGTAIDRAKGLIHSGSAWQHLEKIIAISKELAP